MTPESLAALEATLSVCQEPLFRKLWQERRLWVDRPPVILDSIDRLTAAALITARRERYPLLVVLPDRQPYRSAVLLAMNLLTYWKDESRPGSQLRPVLYLGAHGVHDQLARVHVRGLALEDVFTRRRVRRSQVEVGGGGGGGDTLPELVTSVAPADPAAIISHIRPGLIAIDLADAPRASWVQSALAAAESQGAPVIGWGLNPLSEGANAFATHGFRYVWPVGSGHLDVQPAVLMGRNSEELAERLAAARRALVAATPNYGGSLATSALRAHWGRLRALENLSVPLALHEAEAGRLWGLRSMVNWRSLSERFREACASDRLLTTALAEAGHYLDEGEALLTTASPPLWQALVELCIDEPPVHEDRLLIFPGSARLGLFLLGLRAYYNVTVDDLNSLRIWPVTPAELRTQSTRRDVSAVGHMAYDSEKAQSMRLRHLHFAGLPSVGDAPAIGVLLGERHLDVLVYPHQQSALAARVREWGKAADWSFASRARIIAEITHSPTATTLDDISPAITFSVSRNFVLPDKNPQGARTHRPHSWLNLDPTTEVASVLEGGVEADEVCLPRETPAPESQQSWCETAICLHLSGHWLLRCASDMIVQVVMSTAEGVRSEERFVRSIRPGDKLMLIHGQRRQSLYELLVDRLHQHPAMLLHITLIERWQQEVARAYARRRVDDGLTLEELLAALRRRGSHIETAQAIGFWLRGETLAPSDTEDLLRLAEELGVPFLRDQRDLIVRAANRLRGLHRGLANRLNHWLDTQLNDGGSTADDVLVDAEVGLRFSDFKDVLLVVRVERIEIEVGPFLSNDLGQPEREAEA